MMNSKLYETIFTRKSSRKYDMIPLAPEVITKIKEFASQVKPLEQTIHYELVYLDTKDVKNILPIKAPHYICLYSEKKDGYLMNAGYVLQQIDLYLSANDLGSCWLGVAKPTKAVMQNKGELEYVIMLAFGHTTEQVHRTEVSQFRRKSHALISNISNPTNHADTTPTIDIADVFEPVRLAPSASNTQPWFFSGNTEVITVSREKLNIIKAPLYGRMNQIDIGIALCHLWLALDHQGKAVTYDYKESLVIKGYEFMVNVNVV